MRNCPYVDMRLMRALHHSSVCLMHAPHHFRILFQVMLVTMLLLPQLRSCQALLVSCPSLLGICPALLGSRPALTGYCPFGCAAAWVCSCPARIGWIPARLGFVEGRQWGIYSRRSRGMAMPDGNDNMDLRLSSPSGAHANGCATAPRATF